jgi:hypothetical protein
LLGLVLSVCICLSHNMVTLPPWLVSTDFGTCSYQCFFVQLCFYPIIIIMLSSSSSSSLQSSLDYLSPLVFYSCPPLLQKNYKTFFEYGTELHYFWILAKPVMHTHCFDHMNLICMGDMSYL